MITYGKYTGNLKVILKQNNEGFFVLDVINTGNNLVRLTTDVSGEAFVKLFKSILNSNVEGFIDSLLENVVSGEYRKYWFIPFFTKKLEKNILSSMVKLVKEKYKNADNIWR